MKPLPERYKFTTELMSTDPKRAAVIRTLREKAEDGERTEYIVDAVAEKMEWEA